MISQEEKKQLLFKAVSILLITLILFSVVRILTFNYNLISSASVYLLMIKEFLFSLISTIIIIFILYLFLNKQLYNANNKAKIYAFTDALTGLHNRHYLNEFLENFSFLCKNNTIYAAVFIDIDKFKLVNDSLGHAAGDCILKILALKLKSLTREKDLLCRYGGEEFVLIFTNISKEDALKRTEQIRASVQNMLFNCKQKTITISVGLSFGTKDDDINLILQEADKALFDAKDAGRNCVKVFTS